MKKTHFIDLLKCIKTNIVSFVAITLFIALGVALFCGLGWTRFSSYVFIDETYKQANVHTLEISYEIISATSSDIEEIKQVDGVSEVEGIRRSYEKFVYNGNRFQTYVTQLTKKIDKPIYVEGNLPNGVGEIAVEGFWAKEQGLKIGDKITFEGSMVLLKQSEFTVTAFVESGAYFESSVISYGTSPYNTLPINCIMFAGEESFSEYYAFYSGILVTNDTLNSLNSFSDEYLKKESEFKNAVSNVVDTTLNQIKCKSQLVSYRFCETASDIQGDSRLTLALLFVVVGILVCYSSLSRVVSDQGVLIGTKKALGFSEWEIKSFYFGFSLFAIILGILVGVLLAICLVEPVVLSGVKIAFVVDGLKVYFGWKDLLIIAGVEAVSILLSTVIAVRGVLKKSAKDLINNVKKTSTKTRFYEKTRLYKKFSLLSQIILNNFFNDKKRVIGTIIGIVGCTALIVTSFTYSNVINNSYTMHYKEYYSFDYVVYYDRFNDGAKDKIGKYLQDECGLDIASVFFNDVYMRNPDGTAIICNLYVPENVQSFKKLVNLSAVGNNTANPYSGVWLTESYQNYYKLKPTDSVNIVTNLGKNIEVVPNGYAHHYLMNVSCYMDVETYKATFGESEYVTNSFLLNSNGKDMSVINEKLMKIDGFSSVFNYKSNAYSVFNVINRLSSTLVIVYIVLAVALSVLVLLNLLSLFVSEKKKELIVMMINGYSIKDAKKYIYSDTIFLSAVGIILGVVFGELLGNFSASVFQNSNIIFHLMVDWKSALIGIGLSVVLILIMSIISLRKISKFKLSDISK